MSTWERFEQADVDPEDQILCAFCTPDTDDIAAMPGKQIVIRSAEWQMPCRCGESDCGGVIYACPTCKTSGRAARLISRE